MSSSAQDILFQRLRIAGLLLLAALFAVVLYRTAWLCDDAYITYRSIDNVVHGHGLTFNPGERVQTFTHPLWALVHVPAYAIIGDIYDTGILLTFLFSGLAVALLCLKIAETPSRKALALLAVLFSTAWMDYATSGLENPMTHVLLIAFAWIYLDRERGRRTLFYLALLTGLGAMNRMDTVLLFGPVLAWEFWRQRGWREVGTVAMGLAPFLLWEAFALFYYGFPFPNTAYAKLNLATADGVLSAQGWHYFWHTIRWDPLTIVLILSGLVAPFVARN
ncbi:MAG: hypothetical protein AAF570_23445, partial [Bacteroidota bacterium]